MNLQQDNTEEPLTNLQREILKVYKAEISEAKLKEVKKILSDYLTKRAIRLADETRNEQHWNHQKDRRIASTENADTL